MGDLHFCTMFHKTEKLDNIIIFHTNTAMRSGLSNQKFFIRSMKINLPIFRVLVGWVKASERQNLRSDSIFASIDGFEVCNTLGTFSLKTVIFSDFPSILWLILSVPDGVCLELSAFPIPFLAVETG